MVVVIFFMLGSLLVLLWWKGCEWEPACMVHFTDEAIHMVGGKNATGE